jgi:translation initiation factor IF-2
MTEQQPNNDMNQEASAQATTAPSRPTQEHPIDLPSTIAVNQLATMLNVGAIEVIKQLMRIGVMANINQVIDYEIAAPIAQGYGRTPSRLMEQDSVGHHEANDANGAEVSARPPVVTILGHVDHGKTTLLDAIRNSELAESEIGGITQRIGAYQIQHNKDLITFIDTPGHEAFAAMRARGAQVTDIAIIVVAADDGIMPQTLEAISHVKAASVPIIVAINKMDVPGADTERIKRQLAEQDLLVEEWGGAIISVEVSAKDGSGVENLIDHILLVAEISELRAQHQGPARGVVIEAQMNKTKGPMATALVQSGTLKLGDSIVAGSTWGKVKAMFNDQGKRIEEAGPSTPVEILGFDEQPGSGELFISTENEKTARDTAKKRQLEQRTTRLNSRSLQEMYQRIQVGDVQDLNIIVKTDARGTIEAIREALENLHTDQARVHVLHSASGSITESDILLASASDAIVLAFSTRTEPGAAKLAETLRIEIRYYDIIYQLTDDIELALSGLVVEEQSVVEEGTAEVRAVFPHGRRVRIAGIYVQSGKVTRSSWARVIRNDQTIHESAITSLRHFQEDVGEVQNGLECGIVLDGFNEYQEGDTVEIFRRQ